jgi:hypothetical protein
MKQILIFSICCLMIFNSCAPKISTSISKNYPPLDYREDVKVFGLQDPIPSSSEEIGTVKIGDTGFSSNCDWEVVIDKAKIEARKIGGNAIKIIDHIPPSLMGSSCDRITAKILKVENFNTIASTIKEDSSLVNADYAIIHVYRYSGAGAFVSYDLHLGDTVICRVSNRWKKTIKIRKDGLNTLWAKTEVKEELPINIKFGKEYYIRCGITMGLLVGRPSLELIDNQVGKAEFQSIKLKKSDKRDMLVLNDGRELECIINSEDNDNIFITLFKNNNEIKTQVSKSQIKSIQRSE